MEIIKIPANAVQIISTSSKGDQSKWQLEERWIKQNTRGYEGQAEVLASLILQCSILSSNNYVKYYPCKIELPDGTRQQGCYSYDFRGKLQEVTLEHLFEVNFTSTDTILNSQESAARKFEQLMSQVEQFTGMNVREDIARLFAFDALILNEDRHTNNILFLYDPIHHSWQLAPIFDNGLSLLSDEKDYKIGTPISVLIRQVKAKPLTSSFSKQLRLYTGEPFIDKAKLLKQLEETDIDFGRAKEVLLAQLRNPAFAHLFIPL